MEYFLTDLVDAVSRPPDNIKKFCFGEGILLKLQPTAYGLI